MAGHINDIIHTTSNPVIALMISSGSITSELRVGQQNFGYLLPRCSSTYVVALVHVQVGVHIPLMCAPHSSCHTRPWLLERQNALDVVAFDLFAGDRVNDCRFDTKEW